MAMMNKPPRGLPPLPPPQSANRPAMPATPPGQGMGPPSLPPGFAGGMPGGMPPRLPPRMPMPSGGMPPGLGGGMPPGMANRPPPPMPMPAAPPMGPPGMGGGLMPARNPVPAKPAGGPTPNASATAREHASPNARFNRSLMPSNAKPAKKDPLSEVFQRSGRSLPPPPRGMAGQKSGGSSRLPGVSKKVR